MSKLIFTLICLSAFGGAIPCQARIITVDDDGPADFNNIQAAIDDANDGDTIIASDGIYTGTGNRDIDFNGKALTVRSQNGPENCIIDCQGSWENPHRAFYFHSNENQQSIVDGFTIIHGCAYTTSHIWSVGGGAIRCEASSPMVRNNIIKWNQAKAGSGIFCLHSSAIIANNTIKENGYCFNNIGAGIYCYFSDPILMNNTIRFNQAEYLGGGLTLWHCLAKLTNNIIAGNMVTDGDGGGIHCRNSSLIITNNTITGNFAGSGGEISGGGGMMVIGSSVTVTNSIIWANRAFIPGDQIVTVEDTGQSWSGIEFEERPISLTVRYTDVEGYSQGEGNIDADPCFADPNNGDYHLMSQAGRWDANEGRWTKDEVTSLCIDAGDPSSPIGLEPFPNGGIINMGAYGGTEQASKSYFGEPPCETIMAGDINGDCKVNFKDFALMAYHWLEEK